MKPFNLEKARDGEHFQLCGDKGNNEYRFIGTRENGFIVFERKGKVYERWILESTSPLNLCMLPEKKVYKGLLVKWHHSSENLLWTDNPRNRTHIEEMGHKILKEFEIEYEDES